MAYANDDLSNVNPAIYTQVYPTTTAAQAAALPSATQFVETVGKSAPNDGGGATYQVVTTAPTTGSINLQPDGSTPRYGKILDRVLTPAQFGAYPSTADCRQAFLDLTAELQWRGGGRVEFPDGKTFNIFSTLPADQTTIFSFSNLKHLAMRFNGSVIDTAQDLATNHRVVYGVLASNCDDLELDVGFTQNAYHALSDQGGIDGVYLADSCRGVEAKIYMLGGLSGLIAARSKVLTPDMRAREIDAVIRTTNTFYPCNTQANGDQLTAKIFSQNAGRSYFPYNVSQHDVMVESYGHSQAFNDVLIKTYASANALDSITEDIKVLYKRRNLSGDIHDSSSVTIQFDQANAPPAYYPGAIRDVSIELDIDGTNLMTPNRIVEFVVSDQYTGVIDNTPVAHELTNVSVSGRVANLTNTTAPVLVDFFTQNTLTSAFNFSDIRVENLKATNTSGASISIAGQGLSGRFAVRDVNIDGPIITSNMTSSVLYRNVVSSNFQSRATISAAPIKQDAGGTVTLGGGGASTLWVDVVDDLVHLEGKIFFGNTSAPTFPNSGSAFSVPLPIAYAFTPIGEALGVCYGADPGLNPDRGLTSIESGKIYFLNPYGGKYQDNSPFSSWTTGSFLYYSLTFTKQ